MSDAETVVVTGASSGLGWELARLFARDQHHLVLVARRGDRLNRLAEQISEAGGKRPLVVTADLSQREGVSQVVEAIANKRLEVDVVVNSAGFGTVGPFVDTSLERQLDMIQVNVSSLVQLTGVFLPGMIERGSGGVLNIASTAAFQAGPNMAVYYATKAFVQSFSEALHEEVSGTGVVVSTCSPGAIATGFGDVSGIDASPFFRSHAANVEQVAQVAYRGFRQGKPVVIPGLKNRVSAIAVKWMPRAWSRKIVKRIKSL